MKKTPSLRESIEAQKALDNFLAESEEYFQLVAQENPELSLQRVKPALNDFTHDATDKEIAFRGDTNIKPAKTSLRLSQAHIDEIAFCAYNPIYMARNYSKIVHQDYGVIPFEMWPYQQKVAKSFFGDKRALLCWPRQAGKTITVAYMLLFYCIFNNMKNVAIVANKRATAVEILDRIKLVYLNLPMWLKPGVVKWGEGQIVFENGCKIIAAATTSASIRGTSISCVNKDAKITVKSEEYGVETITMEELEKRLEQENRETANEDTDDVCFEIKPRGIAKAFNFHPGDGWVEGHLFKKNRK